MEMNKSSELVSVNPIATETEPLSGPKTTPMERLLDQADQAVRLGNIQESREHLTRIFELLAGSSPNQLGIHGTSQYGVDSFQMRRTA
ncbi:MAG: hypothetical protein ABI972_22075 [Acidobacteriota bacterium]